ncbi:MAG TPA: hypothetical protein VE890_09515 [Thermoguttaceae bacterium]|nr:hypothetical protein [Thermoguttaceae bacterium]
MVGKLTRITIAAGAMATACCFLLADAGQARAGDHRTSPELFYNYYAPSGPSGLSTQLYVAPRPTPPLVGHTYITYPPLMPHEWLYPHSRNYVRRNPNGGTTRTSVMWTHSLFNFGGLHRGPSLLPSPPLTHKGHYNAGWVTNHY